ncbi:zinc finger protein on ecdysone puffs isoform X2 [Plodia interpunctella]|uniref:zinc finger protein on ecdysone puffs isoform X2 n=1 Tax=Plodia interpunctella TaxID=58824 RepID=UPI00236750BD|nr:zinc finger protein on ecdysone puffs isoform X2 [Plodia interpunctella]
MIATRTSVVEAECRHGREAAQELVSQTSCRWREVLPKLPWPWLATSSICSNRARPPYRLCWTCLSGVILAPIWVGMIVVTGPTGDQEDKNKSATEQSEGKEEDEDKKESPKSRYDEIHQALLKCHICNKTMWDGRSFENHLNGRAHSIMMQKTAESYALTADTMRQEIKIREMKRTRKAGQQPSRDFYCAMCDMYAADGPIHRTTVGHRKLKKYLHPTCTSCHKEMPTRIELDEHRLTAEHLKVMQEKQEVISKPKPEVMVISTLSMEQMYLRDDRQRWRRGDHHDDRRNKDKDDKDQDEEKKDQEGEDTEKEIKQEPGEEKKEQQLDAENTVLDYKEGDDLSNVTEDMFPAYSTERGVGSSFLSDFRCVQCSLCRKLLDSDETAAVHLRTWRHHQLFLRLLTDKCNANKQQEDHEPEPEAAQDGNKRAMNSEENGNWKRRKTTTDDDHNLEDLEDIHMKEEPRSEVEADVEMEGEPGPDDLEDWADHGDDEQEHVENGSEQKAAQPVEKEPSPAPEPEPEPEPEQRPEPEARPAARSPRTRARGRGRGRGRPRY